MGLDNQSPALFGQTPWQTVGPFFHFGLVLDGVADLVGDGAADAIEIVGRVFEAGGTPVPDALIEIWQADGEGRYNSPDDPRHAPGLEAGFTGFGRVATGPDGGFRLRTIRPGRVPGPGNSLQAPHIAISVLGRGLMKRLATRLYFADAEGNDLDPILSLVPDVRRGTLIATAEASAVWRFDIHLQGEHETVFFDV